MPIKNIRDIKSELRAKHKRIRAACPQNLKKSLDDKLYSRFIELPQYQACQTLFAFVSSPIEVNTQKIIEHALSQGKRVALPKCKNNHGEMDFYYITSFSELEEGMFSIMEPSVEKCQLVTDYSQGVCIVPGLCFDLEGFRVGFGKGYYDRLLQEFGGFTVGLCYSKCIESNLPKGKFDRPVDMIITEKYISRIAKG